MEVERLGKRCDVGSTRKNLLRINCNIKGMNMSCFTFIKSKYVFRKTLK